MMMMENNGNNINDALFPVVFFDGEREIDLGTVLITPSMNFKGFQSVISQKIGISPHQITTYFTPLHQHQHYHHRRRHPVTNKFNFAAAIPESNSSFFLVVLKRSRRVRRRRPKPAPEEEEEVFSPEMDNFVLLRRNPNPVNFYSGEPEYADYLSRLMMMKRENERYLMSLNLNSNVYSDLSLFPRGNHFGMSSDDGVSSSGGGSENRVVFCDVCLNAKMEGKTVSFHWCKNDAVTMMHRSPAGPIGPPSKNKPY